MQDPFNNPSLICGVNQYLEFIDSCLVIEKWVGRTYLLKDFKYMDTKAKKKFVFQDNGFKEVMKARD